MIVSNGWKPLGPSTIFNGQTWKSDTAPVSGRVTALVVDPLNADNVWVGTATGGVWQTQDRGVTWTPIMDDQPSLSVGAMALDPNNAKRLYVATGESNDAGESLPGAGILIYGEEPEPGWTLKGKDKLLGKRCYRILAIKTAGQNRILVATNEGLYESTDDGGTFNFVQIANPAPEKVTDIAFVPAANPNDSVLFAAVWGNGVYRKKNSDASFTALKKGPADLCNDAGIERISISICDSQPANMYVLFGKTSDGMGYHGVWYSAQSGADGTWTKRSLPGKASGNRYKNVIAVHPSDPTLVLFGETELWKSPDGGQSWNRVSENNGDSHGIHADQHVVVFSPMDANAVWAGNDGGVWLSSDKGDTFYSRNRGLQTIQFYSLAQHPHERAMMIGGAQDNGTSRYLGTPAWQLSSGGDGFFCAIDYNQPKTCYASYVYYQDKDIKAIQRSDDWGSPGSFKYRVSNIKYTFKDDNHPFYVPFVIDPANSDVLYLGSNRLYRTEDNGGEWKEVRDAATQSAFSTGDTWDLAITAIAVDPADTKNVYVGTLDGRLIKLRQDDTDKYLFTVDSSSPTKGVIVSDIAVPPGEPDNAILVAFGSPQLSWTSVTDLPAGRIWVNKGPANARTWDSLYDAKLDLKNINGVDIDHHLNPVNAIAIDYNPPGGGYYVYIGCNTGIFRRKGISKADPTVTWQPYAENLPNVAIGDLQFHKGKRVLRAATMGRSVWEREVDQDPGVNPVDLTVRDNILDLGGITPDSGTDPGSGDTVTPFSGVDVKIDTPFLGIGSFATLISTADYTPAGDPDYVAFAQLGCDNFRKDVTSRVYVQVINRGPMDAASVKVRAFWAGKVSGAYPDLPDDFWAKFPDNDPADTTKWKPLGAAVSFDKVTASEPKVARWEYKMPADAPDPVGLLVCVTCPSDPINETSKTVADITKKNKHIALREVGVNIEAAAIVVGVLLLVGVAAIGVGLGVSKLTQK